MCTVFSVKAILYTAGHRAALTTAMRKIVWIWPRQRCKESNMNTFYRISIATVRLRTMHHAFLNVSTNMSMGYNQTRNSAAYNDSLNCFYNRGLSYR